MKHMKILFFFLFAFSIFAEASDLRISKAMLNNSKMPFVERSQALALNVHYKDIKSLREKISSSINRQLKFLQSWDRNGEAHVTTITPPEFSNTLSKYVPEQKMNEIARSFKIQESDIEVLGIGSGKKKFGEETGETFFVIVKSENLLKIRDAIYQEYLKAGGPARNFNPKNFYPHVTIGYTHSDIHEQDGLIKDVQHSLDSRFTLIVE